MKSYNYEMFELRKNFYFGQFHILTCFSKEPLGNPQLITRYSWTWTGLVCLWWGDFRPLLPPDISQWLNGCPLLIMLAPDPTRNNQHVIIPNQIWYYNFHKYAIKVSVNKRLIKKECMGDR